MNLTPKSWKMKSEITAEIAQIGDVISYTDSCNFNRYQIIDRDETTITIQDVKDPDWQDIKSFDRLNKRWEFCREVDWDD